MEKKIKKQKNKFRKLKLHLIVLIFYVIFTIFMTYPLVFNMNSSLPSGGETYVFVWNLWHTKKALFEGNNLFFTNYIFYPKGESLVFHSFSMFNSLLSIPLQIFFNLTTTYNILFLLSFILTGFGTYFLIFYLTKNRKAGFISGLLLAFFPYRFVHIAHLNLLTLQWVPFFILYFIKTFKERTIKNAILSSIFLTFTALSSWYYLAFIFLFIVVFLIYNIFYKRDYILDKKFIRFFVLMLLLFAIFIYPFVYPMLTTEDFYPEDSIDSAVVHSADIAAFFVPSTTHSVFGKYVEPFYNHINTYNGKLYGNIEESTVFLGYLTLILTFFAIIKKYKKIKFWLLTAFIFFILSLGPALHFNNLVLIPVEGWNLDKLAKDIYPNINEDALEILKNNIAVPLPYLVLYSIPYFNILRNPSRFIVILMLFLSIVVGITCSNIFDKIKNKKLFKKYNAEKVLFIIFIVIITFEFLQIPLNLSYKEIPEFYYNISKDNSFYSILDLPLCNDTISCYNTKLKEYQLYQTIHNKPIFVGVISRYPLDTFDLIRNTELNKLTSNETILDLPEINRELLREYNVGFIILHKSNLNEETLDHLKNLLSIYEIVYEDDILISYKPKTIQ
ncbi:MAG: hypothetical protein GTN36_02190 [Candidatus Aenigmarchaeota archaeon]|nr:hypothetical protein [Candidatus Aenigmarchaeota archaeon]